MRAVALLCEQWNHNWNHHWESVHGALQGISEAESQWQHSMYSLEAPEEGWPLPGTIQWHIAHMTHCNRFYAAVLAQRPNKPDEPDFALPRTLDELVAALHASHEAVTTQLHRLEDQHLQDLVFTGKTVAEFMAATLRHEIWHSGQIRVIHRLWTTSRP